jgi:hypothetical protein
VSVGSVTARIARRICDVEPVGYSQPDRRTWFANADWEGHCSSPQNADCSSLAAGAVCYGLHDTYGVPWGHPALLEINDFWTGNLRQGLEARGFDEVNWENENLTPDGGFKVGDIVLSAANEGGVGHVVIVVEDGFDPLESEAWIAEDGSIDGYLGDQTGQETRTARYSEHPHTQAGRWTSCHRFNEAKFLAQWPEFAKGKAASTAPAPARPASAAPAHAHGIDVSSYQGGLYIPPIWADFVIVKATEDDDYVNPYKDSQAQDTLSAGKRLGFYHFARPGDAAAQARCFVDAVRGYIGKATLWLDWEANAVEQGPGWAKTFLDTVRSLTGSTPGIYMNDSALNGYDWSVVAGEYPLWYADPENYNTVYMGYIDPAVPSVPYWGQPLIHQYSQCGQLPGYNGNLDFDRLRDRSAWDAMIGGGHVAASAPAAPVAQASPYTGRWNKSDGQGELVCDGDLGPATIARFQQVMGTPIDGELDDDGSPAIERFQEFLNQNVHAPSQEQLNGEPALDVDGVAGPATWRCFQFLVLAWHSDYVPSGWSFGNWIDGDPGEGTIRALQRALNDSHANSGRLW